VQLRTEKNDRLATLDGLRGLAAIAVALFHGSAIFNLGWIPRHAYLAVDFFFLLSGYVIGRSFDRRLQQGWVIGFLRRRLIRLYPFIVAGSLIGFLELVLDGVFGRTLSISQAGLDLVSALFLIPTPPLISNGWRIFPVDPPLWSLFFEAAAYVAYAVAAPFLRNRYLWLMVGVSGLALAWAMFAGNGDDFGLVNFRLAGLRVTFSFFLGVALYRALGPKPKHFAMPFIATPMIFIVLVVVLLSPMPLGWIGDFVAVFAVFPCLLVFALIANPGGGRSRAASFTFGLTSYPVYAIHFPLFRLAYEALFRKFDLTGRTLGMVATLAAVLFLSWLLAVLYDRPLRRWLSAVTSGPDSPGSPEGSPEAQSSSGYLV
jgi:peptidoglycan/LPS O-acetylase OafA/YrhL